MKKIISVILIFTLCLGLYTSCAFAATATDVSDSTTHTRLQTIIDYLRNYMPTFNGQSLTNSNLSDIKSMLGFTGTVDLKGALSIMNDHLANIDSALTGSSGSGLATILENIYNSLVHTSTGGAVVSWLSDVHSRLQTIVIQTTNTSANTANIASTNSSINTNIQTLNDYFFNNFNKSYSLTSWNNPLNTVNWTTYNQVTSGSIFDQLLTTLRFMNNNNMGFYYKTLNAQLGVYNESHSGVNWLNNQSVSYSARSLADGTFYWLSMIQAPISRLAYVHASDEEIAARQKAEANQTAVVDNFIDPSGSGSLPTSSIGSVSDMSDSFKDNFSTDASPTGLFDIFNYDHGSWFSQETADQLDTTNINTRSLKAAPYDDFETPFLDQQIDEIYDTLGVKK